MNVAVVVLDDLHVEGYGDFGDMGVKLLETLGEVRCVKFDYIRQGVLPDWTAFDVVYLTGSRLDAHEENAFNARLVEYLQEVLEAIEGGACVKILGVCFGHQILARAAGFQVVPNPKGWEVGLHDNGAYAVQMFHRDVVVPMAQTKWDTIGTTDRCVIHTLRAPNVLTFQGHPEFGAQYTREASERALVAGKYDASVHEQVLQGALLAIEEPDPRLRALLLQFIRTQ